MVCALSYKQDIFNEERAPLLAAWGSGRAVLAVLHLIC
jgi:hypothetical protein